MNKRKNKINPKRPKILKLNLSATMVVAGAIIFIIVAIITAKIIATAISSNTQKAMAEEETKGYTMVESTEIGEDGSPIKVPVPDGYTASQVPGETTVSGGFVIYEGDVDWSKIEDLDSYAEVETQAEEIDSSLENSNLTDNANTDVASTESNSSNATNNTDSSTIDGDKTDEVAEEQTQDENTEQEDSQEESATNETDATQTEDTNQEDRVGTEQIDQLSSNEEKANESETDLESQEINQEENIEEEQIENTEIDPEVSEQTNNAIVNEEEEITNEEAGVATMSEEGNTGVATLAEGETPTTVFDLQTSTNQYVWVPVKDVSRIYGVDSNGKLWGKLYNYSLTGRTNKNWSENSTSGVMSISSKTSYREPDVTHYRTNYDVDGKLQSRLDGIEQYQMLSQEMEENFYKMIESVKKYGGFYIGRYETGDLSKEKAVVKKMNTDINYQTWYTMYEKCKNLAGEKENIETSIISGSLWDETLQWLVETEAEISTGETIDYTLIEDSTKWGNYENATFEYTTTSGETSTKNESSSTRIPTGSAEYTKVNNIYDMAGNMWEWTLEVASANRIPRGNDYNSSSSSVSSYITPSNPTNGQIDRGSRCVLYIK